MAYKQKGSPLHKHMVNSWEEEDVKRGRKLEAEGGDTTDLMNKILELQKDNNV